MGAKYANINIKMRDAEKLKGVLSEYYQGVKEKNLKLFSRFKEMPDDLLKMICKSHSEYVICQFTEKWLTILNANFGWESVDAVALAISKHINEPILTIGYFDDELVTMSIIENNKILTKHISGLGLSAYEIDAEKEDAIIFNEYLELDQELDVIEEILSIRLNHFTELDDKIQRLSELTGIQLGVGIEDYDFYISENKIAFEVIDFECS